MKTIDKNTNIGPLHKFICIFTFLILLASCDSFTEVDPPQSELTASAVFEDAASVNAALANIYAKMRDEVLVTGQGNGIGTLLGLYADELDYYGIPGEAAESFYRHSVLPSNPEVSSLWNGTYNLIYSANSILEGLQHSQSLAQEEKMPLMGEALFLRAYLHSYLAQLFGPIPYITTTDYKINRKVSRIPENEAYLLMVQDLLEAKSFLAAQPMPNERIKPSSLACNAVLARLYLYLGQYREAAAAASMAIDDGALQLGNSTENVFLIGSPSTIWQLKSENNSATWEAFTFIFTDYPPFVALSPFLVHSFEPGDTRRLNWIGEAVSGGQTFYYPYKYKDPIGGTEYSILLRLAEQFLIRAEARLYLNDLGGALQDLNQIRSRAGLPLLNSTSPAQIEQAIAEERRHELFAEQGHRWFFLKRTGRAGEVLAPLKPNWRSTDILLPIPEMELNLNPNLQPQNPGY